MTTPHHTQRPDTGRGKRVVIIDGEHAGRRGIVISRASSVCLGAGRTVGTADVQLLAHAELPPALVTVQASSLEAA